MKVDSVGVTGVMVDRNFCILCALELFISRNLAFRYFTRTCIHVSHAHMYSCIIIRAQWCKCRKHAGARHTRPAAIGVGGTGVQGRAGESAKGFSHGASCATTPRPPPPPPTPQIQQPHTWTAFGRNRSQVRGMCPREVGLNHHTGSGREGRGGDSTCRHPCGTRWGVHPRGRSPLSQTGSSACHCPMT